MPCMSYDDDSCRSSRAVLEEIDNEELNEAIARNDSLAQNLCVALAALESVYQAENKSGFLGSYKGPFGGFIKRNATWKSDEEIQAVLEWWNTHKKKDKEQSDERELRHNALKKLTDAEKKVLGIQDC